MIKVSGIVVRGESKGKALGFPTANIKIGGRLNGGVYAGNVFFEDKKYRAGIFIHKPSHLDRESNLKFTPKNTAYSRCGGENILEAHILNFSGDLYGKEIEVEIGEKIREIKKFKSDEELKGQIEKDLDYICSRE